jgi:hypothetical protein
VEAPREPIGTPKDPFEAGRSAGKKEGAARTIAQTFCLVVGIGLIAAGVLGFFFGGSGFGAGTNVQGEEFIVFEVNGWHNIVHIATGAVLLLLAPKAKVAATGALVFGLVYVVVAVWGFIDGNDVANLIPVNTADNWLHVAIALASLLAAGASGAFAALSSRDAKNAGRPPRAA